MGTYTDSYLISDWYYWSMTPVVFLNTFSNVWSVEVSLGDDTVNNRYNGLRPVINALTDNGFTSGDGTAISPYVLG